MSFGTPARRSVVGISIAVRVPKIKNIYIIIIHTVYLCLSVKGKFQNQIVVDGNIQLPKSNEIIHKYLLSIYVRRKIVL